MTEANKPHQTAWEHNEENKPDPTLPIKPAFGKPTVPAPTVRPEDQPKPKE